MDNAFYWVFEEASVHGAFLEFVEADSADAIAAALPSSVSEDDSVSARESA